MTSFARVLAPYFFVDYWLLALQGLMFEEVVKGMLRPA